MEQRLSRDELVELTRKIMDCEGTESEVDMMILTLEKNVPHPTVSDLIFWPTHGGEVTPEGVVDEALAYQPTENSGQE